MRNSANAEQTELRFERLERLLGERIPLEQVAAILDRLGFEPAKSDAGLSVTVPPWRDSDVQREADLIEEVARIHGLDKLPTTLPARESAVGRLTGTQPLRRRLEDALRDRGLSECVSYSFTAPEALARLRLDEARALRIQNPLSEELSVMRPLLLPGLLDAARHNAARGRPELGLFESAHAYLAERSLEEPDGSPAGERPAEERHHLAALVAGALPRGWRSPETPADFYAIRGLLEGLMATTGVDWSAEAEPRPFLYPGRSAKVVAAGSELGFVGELNPLVLRDWELEGPVSAFELDVEALAALEPPAASYRDVTSFPPVIQDIAVVVDEDVSAREVAAAVHAGGGELLRVARLFDVYRGEQVGEGRKSLALRLEFHASDRTLTDEEVAELRKKIERRLERIGGRLRA